MSKSVQFNEVAVPLSSGEISDAVKEYYGFIPNLARNGRLCLKLMAFLAVLSAVALVAHGSSHAQEDGSMYMIEVLTLQNGATVEQAQAYFASVFPVIASHGLFPVQSYSVKQEGNGTNYQIVNIWRIANPGGLPEIFKDPNYLQHVNVRDKIFDLKSGRTGWMGKEIY